MTEEELEASKLTERDKGEVEDKLVDDLEVDS